MTQLQIPFLKMNGLGNDFVVLNARNYSFSFSNDQRAALGNRETGIGFDQMITIEPARNPKADAFMRIHNQDGSEVDACGNATRCIGRLLMQESGKDSVVIETNAGLLTAFSKVSSNSLITVDMGTPRLEWDQIPLSEEFADTRAIELQIGPIDAPVLHSPSVVNVGNPHAIFWVEDVDAHELEKLGPLLENHPIFPEKANISIAHVFAENKIRMRVWERGAGLTQACGTGACAVGVAAARKQLTGRQTTVLLPGGPLFIDWRESDDHIFMTGETTIEFEGMLDLDSLAYKKTAAGDVVTEPIP
ncbi:diaminopimelate epimerase [Flexibacterium corallicola]|uniref:diaminopimelate epimerase n=1 Tax=Flexibacterium corallicola TaxID=3037259 RepID=UPI00286F4185|nr:diaminopimelate epimerase [Pseudovibrio sp. M1P-2-3]